MPMMSQTPGGAGSVLEPGVMGKDGDQPRAVVEVEHLVLDTDIDAAQGEFGLRREFVLLDVLELEGGDIRHAHDIAGLEVVEVLAGVELFDEIGRGVVALLEEGEQVG